MRSLSRTCAALALGLASQLASTSAHAIEKMANCTLEFVEVGVSLNRIITKCTAATPVPGTAGIWYFALDPTQDPERVKMVLSTLNAAKISGHPVQIFFESDPATGAKQIGGCNNADCRPISRISLF